MLQSIRSFFRAVPTPLAGLALGIASLGMGLEKSLPLHNFGQVLGALTSMTLTLLLAGKFALNPRLLLEELRHPVLGSYVVVWVQGAVRRGEINTNLPVFLVE